MGEPLIYNLASAYIFLFGSVRQKIEYDCIPRNGYAYCILAAADAAKKHGIGRLTLIEFGVAAGAGLLNICSIATQVTGETGVEFDIVGFDSGEGMPPPVDYRDHPEKYFTGDYFIGEKKAALLDLLPSNAKIYYGAIADTLKQAETEIDSVIGFIAIDVDYFSSTRESLRVLDWDPSRYLSSVLMYFDDVQEADDNEYCGELLAIKDFNQRSEMRKITPVNYLSKLRFFKNAFWHGQIYYAHVFDHRFRSNEYNKARGRKPTFLTNPYL
ncbi:MAG: hypothetical protein HY056_04600 [Proteobacteria bacterium]|nr:hypothetical protein [Pseudomonadota bacterium]